VAQKRYNKARNYYDKAYQLQSNLESLAYDRAYLDYLTQKYQQALQTFGQIAQKESDNMMANYYAAICAFKLKYYHKALNYFLITANSPNAKENSEYYAAVCYLYMGNIQKSRHLFENIQKNSHSAILKKDASKWLNYIETNKKQFKAYRLNANISMIYDDNYILASTDDVITDKDDFMINALVVGTYALKQSSAFKMELGFRQFHSFHIDLTQYDFVNSSGGIFLSYHQNETTFSLFLSPEISWMDDKTYLSCQRIEHDIIWQRNRHVKLMAGLTYKLNHYHNDSDYSGHTTSLGMGIESLLPDHEDISFFVHMDAENNSADHREKKYQKGIIQWKLTYNQKKVNWSLGSDFSFKRYLHPYRSYELRRRDLLYKMYGSVSLNGYIIRPEIKIEHMMNSSTIDDFDYHKTAITGACCFAF
jgi:tetratricopeptide (TPR) repeat protein